MIAIFRKIYCLLSPYERRSTILLLLQMILSSLVSTMGIALIFPFMSIILNPQLIKQQKYIYFLYKLTHFSNIHHFLVFMGVFLLCSLVLGNVLAALNAWSSTRFSLLRNQSFSEQLLTKYLFQPYTYFLNKNSSLLTKNIMVEVYIVVQNILLGAMRSVEQMVSVVMIIGLLVLVNPLMSFFVLLVLGGVYAGIYFVVKSKLAKISKGCADTRANMAKIISEGFGGIKYIKFLNKEKNIVDNYSGNAKQFAEYVASSNVIGLFPKYVLETIVFGGLVVLLLYFLIKNSDVSQVIPLLSLYAFAGYRLMPSFQILFNALTQIKSNNSSLDIIYDDIVNLPLEIKKVDSQNLLPLNNLLEIKDISFSYPNVAKYTLHKINISIRANTTVGFVGSTGAGKTTLIDIILGLLEAQEGKLIVDGIELTANNISSWQNNLGYVSQHVYLSDNSIASNIAFGLNVDEIDMQAVKHAAKLANLSDFIEKELSNSYDTMIGERGVRLSGGQMQRVGIARALYRNPQVLILDEATSALDGITEDIILQAVKNIEHQKTIIMIAHRLSTVRECEQIFFMKGGMIVDVGTYEQLIVRNEEFKMMAKQK